MSAEAQTEATGARALLASTAAAVRTLWAPGRRARVFVARDPMRALELVPGGSPAPGLSVSLCWGGDAASDDDPENGPGNTARGTLLCAVAQEASLKPRDEDDATAILAAAESLRAFLLALDLPSLTGRLVYGGMSPLDPYPGADRFAGYALTFHTDYSYPSEEDPDAEED